MNKRINAMTNITMGLETTEGEILAFAVSDDVLEIVAGTAKEKANFTLGACTGLSECPG
jgi:phage tail tube protein FII